MKRMSRLNRISKFPSNFFRVTLHWLDQRLVFRLLVGGVWIRVDGVWSEVFVSMIDTEGTRYFHQLDDDGSFASFASTNVAIEEIQEF